MDKDKIKLLRVKTNASIMLIKKALEESNGDLELAEKYINDNRKLVDREPTFGVIYNYNHMNRIGVMLEVRCGTDFVARTEEFRNLCKELALQITANLEGPLEEQDYCGVVDGDTIKIKDLISNLSKKVSEPIKLHRFIRWELGD